MKAAELRNLSPDELEEKARVLRKELMQARFQAKTGKLECQSVLREKRQEIARILTVVNEMKRKTE